jgi:comEA protein
MLKKLSVKIGFTETEIKVLLFLLAIFLLGFTYLKFIKTGDDFPYKEYDYTKEELALLKSENGNSPDNLSESVNADSVKKKVLQLKDKPYQMSPKKNPPVKSIDLNTASKEDLMKIPGIGEKTAGNILDYRARTGKFSSIDELTNVKGIGEARLAKYRKYLFIK